MEDYKLLATSKISFFQNGAIIQENETLRSPLCKKICPVISKYCENCSIANSENKKSLDARLKRIKDKIETNSTKHPTLLEELIKNANKEKPRYSETAKSFFLGLQSLGTKKTLELISTFGLKSPSARTLQRFSHKIPKYDWFGILSSAVEQAKLYYDSIDYFGSFII